MSYTSIEEIERDFSARIAAEEDGAKKSELRVQMAETKADYRISIAEAKAAKDAEAREVELRNRERQAWTKEALVDFPNASQFPELIGGDTEEAVKGSAKAIHDRVARLQEDTRAAALASVQSGQKPNQEELQRQAQSAYGVVTGAGGGTTPTVNSAVEERMQNYVNRYNDGRRGDYYGERLDISRADTDQYVRDRGGAHLHEQLRRVQEIKYGPTHPLVTSQ